MHMLKSLSLSDFIGVEGNLKSAEIIQNHNGIWCYPIFFEINKNPIELKNYFINLKKILTKRKYNHHNNI